MYAHDSPGYGRADAHIVRKFINYLYIIGSKAHSDRVLHSEDPEWLASHDILEDQFCLLPKTLSATSVDKVLLCYSEVLHAYCSDPKGKDYIDRVRQAGHDEARRFQGHDDCMTRVQKAIRGVVNNSIAKEGFHHVLTEVALLQLRFQLAEGNDNGHQGASTIVLVDLHRTGKIFEDLPLVNPTKHYLTLPLGDATEASHGLFFKVLERVYERKLPLIQVLEKRYTYLLQILNEREWTVDEFRSEVIERIRKDLENNKIYPTTTSNHTASVCPIGSQHAQSDEKYSPLEKKCFEKLSFNGMGNRQEDVIENIDLAGTCEWILQAPQFTQWRNRQDHDKTKCQLWIKGHPGTGKSVTARKVLEVVKQREAELGTAAIFLSYFFHGRSNEPLDKNMMGMSRTLIHQLLKKESSLRSEFAKEYKERFDTQGQDWDWHRSDLTRFLRLGISKSRVRPIHLIIDAFDECEQSDRMPVLYFLQQLIEDAQCKLSICISMRHDTAITSEDTGKLVIDMEKENGVDIQRHVYNTLRMHLSRANIGSLMEEICNRASNNFLWAELVVKQVHSALDRGVDYATTMSLIQQLPKEIECLFGELISRLTEEEKQEACILFQWALFGSKHFHPGRYHHHFRALQYVMLFATKHYTSLKCLHKEQGQLHIHQFSKRINFLSGGLLQCIERSSEPSPSESPSDAAYARNFTLQVIHESVKEWFLGMGFQLVNNGLPSVSTSIDTHISLMKCLISFLSATDILESSMPSPDPIHNGVSRGVVSSANQDIFFRARQVEHNNQIPMELLDCLSVEGNIFSTNLRFTGVSIPGVFRGARAVLKGHYTASILNMLCYHELTLSVRYLVSNTGWADKVDYGTIVSAIGSGRKDTLETVLKFYDPMETELEEEKNLCRVAAQVFYVMEYLTSLLSPFRRRIEGLLPVIELLLAKGVRILPLFDDVLKGFPSHRELLVFQDLMSNERVVQSVSWGTGGEHLLRSLQGTVTRLSKTRWPWTHVWCMELLELSRAAIHSWDMATYTHLRKVFEHMDTEHVGLGEEQVFDISMETTASLNTPGYEGKTLLAIAATFAEHHIVGKLLEKGSDPTIQDDFNMTAFDHAVAGLEPEPKEWLQSLGYNLSSSGMSTGSATPITHVFPLFPKYYQDDLIRVLALLATKEHRPEVVEDVSAE
ncbi:ankyrin [Apiospora saccharicola]|uniref:Ankyrin n=1 Tax=Apiospora saccharicola TaxID=335842 RepID=A0ABR1VBG0_9PEZI